MAPVLLSRSPLSTLTPGEGGNSMSWKEAMSSMAPEDSN